MNPHTKSVALALVMIMTLSLPAVPAHAQTVSLTKTVKTSSGELKVREGERFTISVAASSVGALVWGVLDTVPVGFQVEDGSFGASGVSATAFDFDLGNVAFIARSSNPNSTSRVTISYTVLANTGGTYHLPFAEGFIVDRGRLVFVGRSDIIKNIQIISQTQLDLAEALKRIDSLETKLTRSAAEASQTLSTIRTELRGITSDFTALKEQVGSIGSSVSKLQKDVEGKFDAVQTSLGRVESTAAAAKSAVETAQAQISSTVKAGVDDLRTSISQQVSNFGLAAIAVAAVAAIGAWVQVAWRRRNKA